jgi:hypothetical protein
VEIHGEDTIATTPDGMNFVNSTIVARAAVLDTNLEPVSGLTRAVTIASTYRIRAVAEVEQAEDAAALAGHEARDVDLAVPVLLSTTKGDTTVTFPSAMEETLKARIESRDRTWVANRLRSYPRFGERSEEVLFKAYDEVKGRQDKTVSSLTPDERSVFTRIRNAWGEGLAEVLA